MTRDDLERTLNPYYPTHTLLKRCPHFSAIWKQLQQAVASPEQGWPLNTAQKYEATSTELKIAKLRYLVKALLLDELKAFNTEARNKPEEDSTKPTLHDSLHHSIAVAGAMQSLQLGTADDSEKDVDKSGVSIVGTTKTLLGITPKELTHTSLDIAESIATNQKLLPDFEAHLAAIAEQIVQLIQPDIPATKESALNVLDTTLEASKDMPNQELLEQAASAVMETHSMISSLWEGISTLMNEHVLGDRAKADQERLNYHHIMTQLHSAHAESLLHRIMKELYTSSHVEALQSLNKFLDKELETVSEELQHQTVLLDVYEKLGPSFKDLSKQYTIMKTKLKHALQTEKDMTEMEEDLKLVARTPPTP